LNLSAVKQRHDHQSGRTKRDWPDATASILSPFGLNDRKIPDVWKLAVFR